MINDENMIMDKEIHNNYNETWENLIRYYWSLPVNRFNLIDDVVIERESMPQKNPLENEEILCR